MASLVDRHVGSQARVTRAHQSTRGVLVRGRQLEEKFLGLGPREQVEAFETVGGREDRPDVSELGRRETVSPIRFHGRTEQGLWWDVATTSRTSIRTSHSRGSDSWALHTTSIIVGFVQRA